MSRTAQIAVTVSAVVVALCALALTVQAMTSGLPVHQQMTFNSDELAKRVHKVLLDRGDLPGTSGSMSCPENVAIEQDAAFGCSVMHKERFKTVRVEIVDAESAKIEVGQLSG